MFKVTILGTSSAIPAFSRLPSCQVVTYNARHFLIDCGEGAQFYLSKNKIKISRIDGIFISHLHGDHIFGLPGLLGTMSIYGRKNPLDIFGPRNLESILSNILSLSETHLGFPLNYHFTEDSEIGKPMFETEKIEVLPIPLVHRIFCRGFLFREKPIRPKFNFYMAKSMEIPNSYFSDIKKGKDVVLENGEKISAETLLLPPRASMAYAYCSDTAYCEDIIPIIEGANLLYHEATFLDETKDRAVETMHSTAREAGLIAKKSRVHELLIGHYSARYYDLKPLLDEASELFPNTRLSSEGLEIDFKEYVQ